MNSCLYKATVMHHRFSPKKHRFNYQLFMFYIDLDEIEMLQKKLLLFSFNKFNFFSLRNNEHLQLPAEKPDTAKSIKQHIIDYLKQNDFKKEPSRIMLLTNLNVLGYNFNPVSFYFCFDEHNQPLCSVAEVGNTFGEMKPYFLGKAQFKENSFYLNTTKHFYVSPFIEHDTNFYFKLNVPDSKLNIRIDDFKGNDCFFISTLTGAKKTMNNRHLMWYSVRFPFITLKITGLIHWNAFLLWLKRLPYYKKADNMHLQKNVYRRYKD